MCIATSVAIVIIDKIKDIIQDIKNEIQWILAGCPKPVKIPIKPKERNDGSMRDKDR